MIRADDSCKLIILCAQFLYALSIVRKQKRSNPKKWTLKLFSILFSTLGYFKRLFIIFLIGSLHNFKNCFTTGNCPIFSTKGFIDWKPCDMSMSTCPNSSYVSDEVYKCKFCCSSKVFKILFNVIIQLSYIIRLHYSISPSDPGCFGNNSMHVESYVYFHSVFIHVKIRATTFRFQCMQINLIFYRSEDYNKAEDIYIRSIIGIVLGVMFILVAVLIVVIAYMRRKILSEFLFLVLFFITK